MAILSSMKGTANAGDTSISIFVGLVTPVVIPLALNVSP